jgi:hypothetical protein
VHVVKPDGSADQVVGTAAANKFIQSVNGATSLAWSPDGTKLAWIERSNDVAGCFSIYMVAVARAGQQQQQPSEVSPEYCSTYVDVHSHLETIFGDAWGPDSKTIAYSFEREDEIQGNPVTLSGQSAIGLLDTATHSVRAIGQTQFAYTEGDCSDTNLDIYLGVAWNVAKNQVIANGESNAPCTTSAPTYASFFDPGRGAEVARWKLPPSSGVIGASPDGKRLIGYENSGTGDVFDASTGQVLYSSGTFSPTSYSPDGDAIVGIQSSSGGDVAIAISGTDLSSPRTLLTSAQAHPYVAPEWGMPRLPVVLVTGLADSHPGIEPGGDCASVGSMAAMCSALQNAGFPVYVVSSSPNGGTVINNSRGF